MPRSSSKPMMSITLVGRSTLSFMRSYKVVAPAMKRAPGAAEEIREIASCGLAARW